MDIDFDEVKQKFPILKVCELLGIELKPETGGTFRGECPFCHKARTFRVTPSKNLSGCFNCRDNKRERYWWDSIGLVQAVKELPDALTAAKWLDGDTEPPVVGGTVKEPVAHGMKPLDNLNAECPEVELLGFEIEDAKRIGIGFQSKGTMQGHVLIPIRLEDGTLIGYLGVTDCLLPKSWQWPDRKVIPIRRPKRAS